MNPPAYERAMSPYDVAPQNRAQRRAAAKNRASALRSQRRSRARIEQALSKFSKE